MTLNALFRTVLRRLVLEPGLWAPFAVVAGLEFMILFLAYWGPHSPLAPIFAPPIRTFYGEIFLHYPYDLLLLPRLMQPFQVGISFFVGALMSAVLVRMLAENESSASWHRNARNVAPRYMSYFLVTVLYYGLLQLVFFGSGYLLRAGFLKARASEVALPPQLIGGLGLSVSFLLAVFIEMAFVYAIPALVIEKLNFWSGIKTSFQRMSQSFFKTFAMVSVPMALVFAAAQFRAFTPSLIEQTFPEISLAVIAGSILIAYLANTVLVASATLLFLNKERS